MNKLKTVCTSLARLPLHYQILIALLAGTLAGVIVNPGTVRLDDLTIVVEQRGDTFTVTSTPAGGGDAVTETFDDEAAFRNRYPELVREFQERAQNAALGVNVTGRTLRFTEDDEKIDVIYTRKHDGRNFVTTVKVADQRQLAEKLPYWMPFYEEHGGGWRAHCTASAKFVGDLFLRLLRMITVPLIVTSLVTGVAGLGNTSRFGSMFGKTLLYYLATSLLAITTGLIVVNLVRPGVGADLPGGDSGPLVGEEQSLLDVFIGLVHNMIPLNPVSSLAGGDFLSIITFSILIGIFIIYTGGQSAETLRRLFESGFEVMMRMTLFIIRLAPVGVFAFMLFATATQGIEIFKTLAWYMLTVFIALLIHAVVILPLILKYVAHRSPWEYVKAMSPALMTAFSTASSNGTLPLTITSVEQRAGVPNRISSFVLPLGATVNMDGTALYEAVAVLFIAQATPNVDLSIASQIVVAVTALLASVGAAGIPHAGLVMMAIVLQAVGLPLEAQGIIIAVDRVLDMCRTSVNVWSDSCGCAVLARFEANNSE